MARCLSGRGWPGILLSLCTSFFRDLSGILSCMWAQLWCRARRWFSGGPMLGWWWDFLSGLSSAGERSVLLSAASSTWVPLQRGGESRFSLFPAVWFFWLLWMAGQHREVNIQCCDLHSLPTTDSALRVLPCSRLLTSEALEGDVRCHSSSIFGSSSCTDSLNRHRWYSDLGNACGGKKCC